MKMVSMEIWVDVLTVLSDCFGMMSCIMFVITACTGCYAADRSLFIPSIATAIVLAAVAMYLGRKAEDLAHAGGWRTYQRFLGWRA